MVIACTIVCLMDTKEPRSLRDRGVLMYYIPFASHLSLRCRGGTLEPVESSVFAIVFVR